MCYLMYTHTLIIIYEIYILYMPNHMWIHKLYIYTQSYTHACTDTCTCMWSYICVGVWKCTSRLTVFMWFVCHIQLYVWIHVHSIHTQSSYWYTCIHTHLQVDGTFLFSFSYFSEYSFSYASQFLLQRCLDIHTLKIFLKYTGTEELGASGVTHVLLSSRCSLLGPLTPSGADCTALSSVRGAWEEVSMLRIWMWPTQTHRTHHLHQKRNSGRKGVPFSPESHQKQNPQLLLYLSLRICAKGSFDWGSRVRDMTVLNTAVFNNFLRV